MLYNSKMKSRSPIRLSYKPYPLTLRHPFRVAWGTRDTTPVVLTQLEMYGYSGYGEASMPPYLGESVESVTTFLERTDLNMVADIEDIESVVNYLEGIAPDNYAAKAAVDIALHDLLGKIWGEPWFRRYGYDPGDAPCTSITIGIDNPETIRLKVKEAEPYPILKIKLGGPNDREIVETVRELTDKPLYADANSGWTNKHHALDMIFWLRDMGVRLIEQPMPGEMTDELAWLVARSPLMVFGDEGLRTADDLEKHGDLYNGVNIKLMKCGGMFSSRKMIALARKRGMKVMIGCMTETSCAISAAAQLAPAADYADLDGNLLITNDCFEGVQIENGRIILPDRPGIGVMKKY